MSNAPHLELISEVLPISRRDFYVTDPTLLSPHNANPIWDGEWLQLDANYGLVRGSGEQTVPAWQVFAERGRYDTQAIGKTPVLFLGGYEAQTDVYSSTGLAVGDPLMITDVSIGGVNKRALAKATGTGVHQVFAYVTRLPTGKVRFWRPGSMNQITLP